MYGMTQICLKEDKGRQTRKNTSMKKKRRRKKERERENAKMARKKILPSAVIIAMRTTVN